jgi:hypothetical protein
MPKYYAEKSVTQLVDHHPRCCNVNIPPDPQQGNKPVPDGIGDLLHQKSKNQIRQKTNSKDLQRLFYYLPQIFKNNHYLPPATCSNKQIPPRITITIYIKTVCNHELPENFNAVPKLFLTDRPKYFREQISSRIRWERKQTKNINAKNILLENAERQKTR